MVDLRDRGSVCIDEDCNLSGGYAHAGPCEPCECPLHHAIHECPQQAESTPLGKCIASLHKSGRELARLLALAEQAARAAVAATDPAERRRLLDEACDAEYEALGDCDACGGLMTALGLDEGVE